MKKEPDAGNGPETMGHAEMLSALFANFVAQQSQTAFMFLGRIPHPETGQPVQDFETAEFLINQLEMIDVKTKGNLSKEEDNLLKQSLTGLRMAFVEAVEGTSARTPAPSAPARSASLDVPSSSETTAQAPSPPAMDAGATEESRKKFTKKY